MSSCFTLPAPKPIPPCLHLPIGLFQVEHPYFQTRQLLPHTIAHFGLGVSTRTKWLQRRLVIPLANAAGETIGYAGRWAADALPPKVSSYAFLGEGQWLAYNLHRALAGSPEMPVLVTGSPFEVFHLYQCGFESVVSLFTLEISDRAIEQLAQHFPQRRFVLFCDETLRGRRLREEITLKLARFACVRAPEFCESGRTVASLTAQEVEEVL